MRRAGEGVDDAQWGTMVALKKKDESSDESEDEENDNAKDDDAEKKAEKKAKKKVDPHSRRVYGMALFVVVSSIIARPT